jgi:hypothetical protein
MPVSLDADFDADGDARRDGSGWVVTARLRHAMLL